MLGVSGKAGNIRGEQLLGGNVFEGPRMSEYPLPPLKTSYAGLQFKEAVEKLGYHPYPHPAANASEAYRNPDGIARPGCAYCGYCERYGCMIGAKAQPSNTLLPVVKKQKNVELTSLTNIKSITDTSSEKTCQADFLTPAETGTIHYQISKQDGSTQLRITKVDTHPR